MFNEVLHAPLIRSEAHLGYLFLRALSFKASEQVYQVQRPNPQVTVLLLPQQVINCRALCHRDVIL